MKQLISMVTNFRFSTATTPPGGSPEKSARAPKSKPEGWISFDEYEDIKELEHGSEAMTCLTKSTATGQVYVVKRYKKYPVHKSNPAVQQRSKDPLPNEATVLLTALRPHPNILRAFGYDYVGHRRCDLYTEFCTGGDLFSKIRETHRHKCVAPEPLALHVFVSMAEALGYLHHGLRWNSEKQRYWQEPGSISFIHGDVKPHNVFLRWSDEAERLGLPDVVLGDFGMSQPAEFTIGTSGTPCYMAPEIIAIWSLDDESSEYHEKATSRQMTTATDIYSLGGTIYELGTNTLHKVRADPHAVRLSSYKAEALTVAVQWCLQHDPEDRSRAMEEELFVAVEKCRKELGRHVARKQLVERKAATKQADRKQEVKNLLELKQVEVQQLEMELLAIQLAESQL